MASQHHAGKGISNLPPKKQKRTSHFGSAGKKRTSTAGQATTAQSRELANLRASVVEAETAPNGIRLKSSRSATIDAREAAKVQLDPGHALAKQKKATKKYRKLEQDKEQQEQQEKEKEQDVHANALTYQRTKPHPPPRTLHSVWPDFQKAIQEQQALQQSLSLLKPGPSGNQGDCREEQEESAPKRSRGCSKLRNDLDFVKLEALFWPTTRPEKRSLLASDKSRKRKVPSWAKLSLEELMAKELEWSALAQQSVQPK
jgi:hypothetical protein